MGGGVKFGYPVSETSLVDLGFNLESVDLTTFANSPLQYLNFTSQFGNSYKYGALTTGWQRDTRDLRVYAFAPDNARLLDELGAWAQVAASQK